MRKIFIPVFVIFFAAYFFPQQNYYVNLIIESVNEDSVVQFVKELSGEVEVSINGVNQTILSRNKHFPGNDIAADYIKQKLESYGIQVIDSNFSDTGRNVIGVKPGIKEPEKVIIICAHYDSMPVDAFSPGADDNASGTAAVLEAARILKEFNTDFTLEFALWDEEEYGLIGASEYAAGAKAENKNIIGVINLDMIAWDNNNDDRVRIHVRNISDSYSLSNEMTAVNTTYSVGLQTIIVDPGRTFSDHSVFWQNNYPAILLIENDAADFNQYYHSASDRLDKFNIPYFVKCCKLGVGTFASLAGIDSYLPVELISFGAELFSGNKVLLSWETASETNNLGFEIERRSELNQNKWRTIAFINGQGHSTNNNRYSFTDVPFNSEGVLQYRLKQIDFNGTFEYSSIAEVNLSPSQYALEQNYPNPFNPVTNIKYSIAVEGEVLLTIYDLLGNKIEEIINEFHQPGTYVVQLNADKLASGIYFYTLQSGDYISTKKLTVLK